MSTSNSFKYRLPAEWEEQQAVLIGWPHAATDWKPYLADITETYLQLADIITRYEYLLVTTPHPTDTHQALATHLTQNQMKRVHIFEVDSNDTWARDYGPITLTHNTFPGKPSTLLDFKFNGWGEKFKAAKDNAITENLFCQKAFNGIRKSYDDFVLEGGSIESDGKGTVFTTSQCLLAPHRNQPMTQEDITHFLMDTLHAQRIVWLNHGNLIGDDTDGHIDTIVRIAPDNTLLYVSCDDFQDEQYADFQALKQELVTLRAMDGKPYRLLKLPMPAPIYDEGDHLSTDKNSQGDRLPATYANFLVINDAVIYPTYHQPNKDEEARKQIQQAFPGRDVIGLDSRTIIRQHGSIHCLTMQLPKGTFNNTI